MSKGEKNVTHQLSVVHLYIYINKHLAYIFWVISMIVERLLKNKTKNKIPCDKPLIYPHDTHGCQYEKQFIYNVL